MSILGDEVFHPIHIKPLEIFYDFESKYADQGTQYKKADIEFKT